MCCLLRWPLLRHQRGRLFPPSLDAQLPLQHSDRASDRHFIDPRLLLPRSGSTLPLSILISTLPPGTSHTHSAHTTSHSPRLPGRHPALRPAHAMGRLDRPRGYHPDNCEFSRHLCDAKNACKQEGEKEAYCGECRDERRELL